MAPSCERPKPQHTQDENPFIAFRRYADEQVSSLFSSITGKHSTPTLQTPDPRWQNFDGNWKSEEHDAKHSPDEDSWVGVRPLTRIGLKKVDIPMKKSTEVSDCSRDDDQAMRCPYRPADQDVPERNQALSEPPTFRYSNLFGQLSREDNTGEPFPGDFMEESPYSPIRLELERMGDAPKWRNAFEDLMALQQGSAMPTMRVREAERDMSEWVASMLVMGLFGGWLSQSRWCPGVGLIAALGHPEMDEDGEEEEELEATELDVYEQARRLMSGFHIPDTAPNDDVSNKLARPATIEAPLESIMSTLTTTERRTLPDGTVHTKVVLKRRFTDGSEECTETVHTVKGSQDLSQAVAQVAKEGFERERQRSEPQSKIEGGKGWFWS